MRIGIVAPPWLPVPPTHYGGTEGVIDVLARGLVVAGHDVELFTTGDATCEVPRQWIYDVPPEPMGTTVPELHHVQAAYQAFRHCDVVHDHTYAGPVWAAALRDHPPVLSTNHGMFSTETCVLYAQLAATVTFNAISYHQRSLARGLPVAAVVHHGLQVERFPFGDGAGGYALYVGRCTPEKGLHRAIAIARRAGVRLVAVAKMREIVEEHYFAERIRPLLGPDVEFLGEVTPTVRDELMRDAVALINPITWPEPFGLVMAEALACGTPVVAYPAGAAPEIVDHGITGFLCGSVEEAAEALTRVPSLDRRACRAAVEARFSAQRMVADYLRLYRLVLSGRSVVELDPGLVGNVARQRR
jgi:glycosyltransferase involved in cell wall biosynthesis